jgi:hypothetical protein
MESMVLQVVPIWVVAVEVAVERLEQPHLEDLV